MYDFEYDDDKSQANLIKYGIDFHAAQELWDDPDLVEFPANAKDEPRFLVIGRIATKHWSAVVTYTNASVHLISVRRSRKREVELYKI